MEVFQGEWPCRAWGQIFGAIAQDVLVRAHALGEVRIDLPDGRFRDTGEWVPTYETTGEHLFSTLGDTLCTVLGLVQSFLVTSFQRALQVRKGRSHVDPLYPVVALQDLHQEAIMVPLGHLERVFGKTYTEEERTFANSLMDADRRDYLIRATAFQAGIPRLDNDIYEIAWMGLVQYLKILCGNVCVLVLQVPLDPHETQATHRRPLSEKTLYECPPPPQQLIESSNTYLHTPVPAQFHEAARLHFPASPSIVYGYWLSDVKDGTVNVATDEEIEAAVDDYPEPTGDDSSNGSICSRPLPKRRGG